MFPDVHVLLRTKLVYQFDHQKGRGDKEALEKNMRETMPIEIVREVFVNHLENKVSRFGKKYNVFETTLTIFRGKEKEVQWPEVVNGFLNVTFLRNL